MIWFYYRRIELCCYRVSTTNVDIMSVWYTEISIARYTDRLTELTPMVNTWSFSHTIGYIFLTWHFHYHIGKLWIIIILTWIRWCIFWLSNTFWCLPFLLCCLSDFWGNKVSTAFETDINCESQFLCNVLTVFIFYSFCTFHIGMSWFVW